MADQKRGNQQDIFKTSTHGLHMGISNNPSHPTSNQIITHQIDINDYYGQYKKIYLSSYMLSSQLQKLIKIKQKIVEKLSKIDKKSNDFKQSIKQKQDNRMRLKRLRRTADEIPREYTCQIDFCGKCYGSEGSLQQHIKIKHPQLYQPKN